MKLNQRMALPPTKSANLWPRAFQHHEHFTSGLRMGHLCTVTARLGFGGICEW